MRAKLSRLILISLILIPKMGQSITYTFTRGNLDNKLWQNALHWTPIAIPNTDTDTVIFSADDQTVTNSSNPTTNTMIMTGKNFHLGNDPFANSIIFAGTSPSVTLTTGSDLYLQNSRFTIEVVLNSDTTFTIGNSSQSQALALEGNVSGTGDIIKSGPAPLSLVASSVSNDITIQQGTVQMNGVTTYSNVISGTGDLEIWSSVTLSGANTYTGSTLLLSNTGITLSGSGDISSSSSLTSLEGSLTLASGAGDKTVRSLSGSGNIYLNSNTLTVNSTTSTIYSGTISGTGGLTKTGINAFTLSAASPYEGATTVSEGQLVLQATADISASSEVEVNGILTLNGSQAIQSLSGSGSVQLDGTTLNIAEGGGTFSGVISEGGSLLKAGAGTQTLSGSNTFLGTVSIQDSGALVLSGSNAYTGATTIYSGTLTLSGAGNIANSSEVINSGTLAINTSSGVPTVNNLSGSGAVSINGNGVTLAFSSDRTHSGTITGSSAFTKIGSGVFTLSGTSPSYTGDARVSQGTLTVSGTLGGSGSVNSSDATFNLTGTLSGAATVSAGSFILNEGTIGGNLEVSIGTFTGSLGTVTGNVIVNSGTLSSAGTTFSGSVTLNGGTFSANGGTIAGDVTVDATSSFTGTSTIGTGAQTFTNSGTVQPGNSTGTITINGDYTQSSTGVLVMEFDSHGQTDLLSVSQTASLGGQLTISPLPGQYKGTESFTLVTGGTAVSNTFSSVVELNEITGSVTYNANSVVYTLGAPQPVMPVARHSPSLKGNARSISAYLFRSGQIASNPDLAAVSDTILRLPLNEFLEAVQRLGPCQFGALPLVSLQSDVRVANGFVQNLKNLPIDDRCENISDCFDSKDESRKNVLWAEPLIYDYIQFVYKQRGIVEQIKFNAITYGANFGFTHFTEGHFCFGWEGAFTQTNLHWSREAGNGRWSSVYFGPGVGWNLNDQRSYFTAVLLGIVNFYDIERRIVFPGLNRVAENQHTGFDILARGDFGTKMNVGMWFTQPEATLNALTVFEPKYTEKGAESLCLTVFSKQDVFIRPEVKVRTGLEICGEKLTVIPALKVGWVANIPITNGYYIARLRNQTFASENQFPTVSFHKTTNQLVAGAECILEGCGFLTSAAFEANYLDQSMIQEAKFRFEWWF